jgi:hypothetical protein
MDTDSKPTVDQEQTILRELQALQQALAHLLTVEQRLLGEQATMNQHINAASRQAYQSQQTNQPSQYMSAMGQRDRALAAAAALQDQLQRIAERKVEIARQQQSLQTRLSAVQSTQRQDDLRLHELLAQSPASVISPPSPCPRITSRFITLPGICQTISIASTISTCRATVQRRYSKPFA